ncbi:hypothetical protein TUM3794_19710 [Shewanella colwelliana]|uniref:HEPN domain-containing protein n=1 Tax=Shewanella colwelliana TaxID=23 RepID=A0ABQ4P068_SHECO|nr:hypothetical protein [Shewanella colwelliana]GIU40847.1 hypothetical protein TUM3794_19710 [Shewanella colwelliana]
MQRMPDVRVWRTANEYQESATILLESGKGWSAAILAALALEIYLKSFLSQEVKIELEGDIFQTFKKTQRGHGLVDLFKRIPREFQDELLTEYSNLGYEHTLLERLERYNNLFFDARYFHEQNPITFVDNLVVKLAKDFRYLVANISKSENSVN